MRLPQRPQPTAVRGVLGEPVEDEPVPERDGDQQWNDRAERYVHVRPRHRYRRRGQQPGGHLVGTDDDRGSPDGRPERRRPVQPRGGRLRDLVGFRPAEAAVFHHAHPGQQRPYQQARQRRRLRRSHPGRQLRQGPRGHLRLRHDHRMGHLPARPDVRGARNRLQPARGRESQQRRGARLRDRADRRPRPGGPVERQPRVGDGGRHRDDRAPAALSGRKCRRRVHGRVRPQRIAVAHRSGQRGQNRCTDRPPERGRSHPEPQPAVRLHQ